MNVIIKGGRVIDPASGLDKVCDVVIDNGIIVKVGTAGKKTAGCSVIDASGKVVAPGLIDIHVHLREPGLEYKETILTGTEAAAAGGFTAVACMPNTKPINDNRAVTDYIVRKGRDEGAVRVYPIGAITKGSTGEELAEIGDMIEAGAVAISDDGKPVTSSVMMRRAMEYSRNFGITVVSHAEDMSLAEGGVMNEGALSTRLGLRGIPAIAEDIASARDILLAEYTGARLHLAHVSTAGTVRLIREAKQRGIAVTAETCPHYFTLTEAAVDGYNTNAKMNPPLRGEEDVAAIREALRDGTIDVIATDHAPHHYSEKDAEFDQAPFGIVGLETALSLTLSLVRDGVMSLSDALAALTTNPAKALGLPGGSLAVGSAADLVIIDLDAEWEVKPEKFRSKGRNTPFAGWKMKGRAAATIVDGKLVYQAEN
ncbi:MAG: dihydroorotase [Nitrospirota bacterium]|nr:dihydroorotase [Nitrospirota bacterium]